MKPAHYIRLFILALAVILSMAFYSINRLRSSGKVKSTEEEQCGARQLQSEFLILESLSRGLLGNNP